jgi:hypothetical protein
MYRTLSALAGGVLLLGVSSAQAEEVILGDAALDQVTAGGFFGIKDNLALGVNFNGAVNDLSGAFSITSGGSCQGNCSGFGG